MRAALAFLIVVGMSAAAAAQTIGLPLPSIGLPLPQIGLPLPTTGLPPLQTPSQPRAHTSPTPGETHRPAPHGHDPRGGRTYVYVVPEYGLGMAGEPLPEPPAAPPGPPPPVGHLDIELQPGVDPQVFIDGAYIGTLDDVGGELTLEPGVHHLDLLDDGYEPLAVDVQIVEDRATRYRGLLTERARPDASASPVPPPPPATIYMIPGCYVGNLPPRDVVLPAGCDPNRASVFPSHR